MHRKVRMSVGQGADQTKNLITPRHGRHGCDFDKKRHSVRACLVNRPLMPDGSEKLRNRLFLLLARPGERAKQSRHVSRGAVGVMQARPRNGVKLVQHDASLCPLWFIVLLRLTVEFLRDVLPRLTQISPTFGTSWKSDFAFAMLRYSH